MTLKSGFRFMVAPRFHLPGEWSRRLLIGSGVQEIDGSFIPRPTWRTPTTEELSMLIAESSETKSLNAVDDCVSLFQLPEHLGSDWWNLLESSAGAIANGQLPGFESFVARVGEFMAFKGLTLPHGADFNVVVSNAAAPSSSDAGLLGCLHFFSARPWAEELPRHWGAINLGDEETSIVLINLSFQQMAEELLRAFPNEPTPAATGELAARFLSRCPEYPAVQMILRPGQGYRLPQRAIVLVGSRASNRDPEVSLTITCESQVSR